MKKDAGIESISKGKDQASKNVPLSVLNIAGDIGLIIRYFISSYSILTTVEKFIFSMYVRLTLRRPNNEMREKVE